METILASLKILELGPEASPQEIEEAYRQLAKVWHPDRFMHDEKLRRFAEKKIKAINKAYDYLQEFGTTASQAAEEVPSAKYPDVEKPAQTVPPSPTETNSTTDCEFDIRIVFGRGVPLRHRIGWTTAVASLFTFTLGIFLYLVGLMDYRDPGHFPAIAIQLSSLPIGLAATMFGYPLRTYGVPATLKLEQRNTGETPLGYALSVIAVGGLFVAMGSYFAAAFQNWEEPYLSTALYSGATWIVSTFLYRVMRGPAGAPIERLQL